MKSCVGSTWCRYGVQDSVAMAIRIENRYRGMRAPHKIKLAVSGCMRECAEAQSKDVGVIATEKGWNLYVCGNGGMKPRHADSARRRPRRSDADPLHRPLPDVLHPHRRPAAAHRAWLEKLEGGIDYLRKVVFDDSLGIGAELEADMQQLSTPTSASGRRRRDDPERLKRFRHFVNSDEPDPNIEFVTERGQPNSAAGAGTVLLSCLDGFLRGCAGVPHRISLLIRSIEDAGNV